MTVLWRYGLSSPYLLICFLFVLVVAAISVVIYRLTFHPLASFPGPVLAASTGLYEAYYQCIKDGGGRYWVEIEKMHKRYGPIVRINPWEVHIADKDWNAVYKNSAKASKPRWFYFRFFGKFPSTNVAESHALHQLRLGPLQAYFASANIQRYMPTIVAQVDKLCGRLRAADGQVVRLSDAFRCLATDVATGFAFGRPFGHLDEPTFDREFNLTLKVVLRTSMLSRHSYGLLLPVLHSLPDSIAKKMNPAFGRVMLMKETMVNCVRRSMNKPEPAPGSPHDMIQTLMSSDLPPEEKTLPRLFSESRSVIMAGTETTATTLVCIAFHLLSASSKLERLRHELGAAEKAKGGALDYADLRELPYITGVVNEGLRMANATPSRLPRVCEDQDLTYKEYIIPKGTAISTTIKDIHNDASVFARPREFLPDRWTDPDERKRLNRYLQPWGRGVRLCLGMELATVDLYLAVSRLFGPRSGFEMTLHDTVEEDWVAYHEWFAAFPKGRGLRVKVHATEKGSSNEDT
ncbi:putative cytochrome P450 [Hypoxylon sp. FL0543]|nr:putative cytochrome P450 [Hypoxylon sp. FL0543]